jgi:hypothetical protein
MEVTRYTKSGFKNDDHYEFSASVVLNPQDNGGEAVTLEADVFRNEDGCTYINTRLRISSYGSSEAEIFLGTGIGLMDIAQACSDIHGLIQCP